MPRRANIILLCEYLQQQVFICRFLKADGWDTRPHNIRPVISPRGRISGEAFVRQQFAKEVAAHRKHRNPGNQVLFVMIDGDNTGHQRRQQSLIDACFEAGVEPPKPDEAIGVFVPT